MYKIGEVADLLSVEKTDIFAKMISHKSLLESNIKKVDGVTYFDQRGVEILKTLLIKSESCTDEIITLDEEDTSVEEYTEIGKTSILSKFEKDRNVLLEQIDILKSELSKLDEELALKDNLLLGYQMKISEDLELLGKYQLQMLKKISHLME